MWIVCGFFWATSKFLPFLVCFPRNGVKIAICCLHIKSYSFLGHCRHWLVSRRIPHRDRKRRQRDKDLGLEEAQHWVHHTGPHQRRVAGRVRAREREFCPHVFLRQHCPAVGVQDVATAGHAQRTRQPTDGMRRVTRRKLDSHLLLW